ncbi:hypothetical protein N8703_05895, partial [Verrucomicrobia bacterium]|nr:hypothetical protein [Verrucomicrobiota bacterium]
YVTHVNDYQASGERMWLQHRSVNWLSFPFPGKVSGCQQRIRMYRFRGPLRGGKGLGPIQSRGMHYL